MGKATSAVLKFEIDDSMGSATDITSYIDDIGGHAVSEATQETTPFGSSHQTYRNVGVQGMDSFSISGFFDDSDPGPSATIGDDSVGSTREVTITYMSGQTRTFDVVVEDFGMTPQQNNLTRWTSSLQPTGSLSGVS